MTQIHDTVRKDSELWPIPQEREVCRLEECMEAIIDYRWKTPNKKKSGVPLITAKIVKNWRINYDDLEYLAEEDYDEWMTRWLPQAWDIVLTTEAPLWEVAQLDSRKVALAQRIITLRGKKDQLNNSYLKYYFMSELWNWSLLSRETWSVVTGIKQSILREVPILLPPLHEQQAIASILWSLDDKIEVLREQNRTLEKMGQTMFYEWFGKYSIEDELPEGWSVGKLGEIVETINWYSYKWSELVEESNHSLVTLKSFDRNWWFQVRWFKPFIGTPKESQQVVIGDLVVAHTDLTQDAEVIWNPAFIFDDGWFEKLYITMDLVKVVTRDKNITNSFLYYLMKSDSFKWHCIWYTSWTTVLHLSKKAIPDYDIILPQDLTLVKQFSDNASIITDKISANVYEIKSLTQIRDSLLPRLMSGKVRVI